jgi:hypothetical protein
MKRAFILVAAVFVASFAIAETRGAWHITTDGTRFHLDISRGNTMHWGQSMDPASFTGLSASILSTKAETPVKFELIRDAGTIHFTGTFSDGDGVGRFTFEPSRGYASALKQLGVSGEIDDEDDLFGLAMSDVSIAFIREMQSLGYRETLDQYRAFRIHGVNPQFVRDLRGLGYDSLSADDLVAFRIHGVSPQFIREMKDLGYSVSADQLVAFRIHGASPEFVRGMKDLGVRGLDADEIVALRIHGATVDYVRELADLGYKNLSSEELVSMRIHGVSTRFIRDLKDAGYSGIPVEKLVDMRIHGISADDVKRMR